MTSPRHVRLIDDESHDGWFNMAADAYVFRKQIERESPHVTLRLYRFSEPTFTVGCGAWRHAPPALHPEVPTIRRMTGGGVVRHGGDLVYSLTAPVAMDDSLRRATASYAVIHGLIRDALDSVVVQTEFFCDNRFERLPVPARAGSGEQEHKPVLAHTSTVFCFDAPVRFDLMCFGEKVAGAGQKRSHGYLLHQGSIAWNRLIQENADLAEARFRRRFARDIADHFQLPIEEIYFSAEELDEIRYHFLRPQAMVPL